MSLKLTAAKRFKYGRTLEVGETFTAKSEAHKRQLLAAGLARAPRRKAVEEHKAVEDRNVVEDGVKYQTRAMTAQDE